MTIPASDQTSQALSSAIHRLEAKEKLCEAQIELATVELRDVKDELNRLRKCRRALRITGRPFGEDGVTARLNRNGGGR